MSFKAPGRNAGDAMVWTVQQVLKPEPERWIARKTNFDGAWVSGPGPPAAASSALTTVSGFSGRWRAIKLQQGRWVNFWTNFGHDGGWNGTNVITTGVVPAVFRPPLTRSFQLSSYWSYGGGGHTNARITVWFEIATNGNLLVGYPSPANFNGEPCGWQATFRYQAST